MEPQNEALCEHCGAQMKEWWHSLSPGLVDALIKFIKAVKTKGVNEIHLQDEMPKYSTALTYNQLSNFQKMRFHGLVAKVEGKGGSWLITKRGGQFLRGEIAVPYKVKTYRNRVIGHSETELRKIEDYRGKLTWYEQDFEFEIHDGKVEATAQAQPALTRLGSNEPWQS